MQNVLRKISVVLLSGILLCGYVNASGAMTVEKQAEKPAAEMAKTIAIKDYSMSAGIVPVVAEGGFERLQSALPDQKDILSAVPERVVKEISVGDLTQSIDADVIVAADETVTQGKLLQRAFTEEEVRDLLRGSDFADDVDELEIIIDGSFLCIRDRNYEINQVGGEDGNYESEELWQRAEALMRQIGSQQVIKSGYAFEGNGGEIYNFETTAVHHGLLLERQSLPIAFICGGSLVNGKIGELNIQVDYSLQEEEEASLMNFDDIVASLEALLQDGVIEPVPSGQAIQKIQLCYMVEQHGKKYDFYPVWNFEVAYTADWLKDAEGPHAQRYVVLNACNGELVEYHIGGVE